MHPAEQFIKYVPWSEAEKKAARRAFEKAFALQCEAIKAEAKRMIAQAVEPSDIWRVQEYLTEQRKIVGRLYDYRYSVLLRVFASLLRDGWLTEEDLAGLRSDKIHEIRLGAKI